MPAGEMDPVYSIGTRNRFDMIDNDIIEDPLELIRAAQEKPSKEKEAKAKAKKDLKPVKQSEKKSVKIETPVENESSEKRSDRPKSDRSRGGRGARGGRGRGGDRGRGRGGSRGGFSPNSTTGQEGFGFNNNNQPSEGFGGGFHKHHSPVAETGDGFNSGFGSGFNSGFGGENNEERRGGRSGFRGGRGGRGGRGRGRGGNREFDRRSGSDKSSVKAVDKRDGSGAFNWGTPQDEINAASEEHTGGFGTPKETEDASNENNEQVQETEEAQVEEIKDEGPQEMTFEEYKKLEENRAKPEYNVRKVDDVRKGMKQLKKPTEEESVANGSFFFPKKSVNETYKSSGRVIEKLNVNIRYSSGENRHLDTTRRGNRGGKGKRSGPGGKKDDSSSAKDAEIALGNDEEFPSL